MGMYTELNIEVEINADNDTLAVIEYMTGKTDATLSDLKLPKHRLFSSPRWEFMLACDSFYFDHTACSSVVDKRPWEEDEHNDRILNVRCDLKNYDDEIEHFLDWIYPFTNTRGFVGYMRYEEDPDPTLIYFTSDGVKYKNLTGVMKQS